MDGPPQHIELHRDPAAADIAKIVPGFLDRRVDALGIAAVDLGEAGDAGPDNVALAIGRDRIEIVGGVVPVVGPGADQAHVPGKDVEELRQLVDPAAPEKLAQRRDPVGLQRIVGAPRDPVRRPHGAEFHRAEGPAIAAHPGLQEEQRAGIPDRVDDQQDQAREQDQRQGRDRDHEIEGALGNPEAGGGWMHGRGNATASRLRCRPHRHIDIELLNMLVHRLTTAHSSHTTRHRFATKFTAVSAGSASTPANIVPVPAHPCSLCAPRASDVRKIAGQMLFTLHIN